MAVSYKAIYNRTEERVEFLLIDFDYYDGNELLADIFHKEYGFYICDKFDGIWYTIIRICLNNCIYELMWHEDVGNSVYCIDKSDEENDILEKRLKNVINIVNRRIQTR